MTAQDHKLVWNSCLQIVRDIIHPQSFKTWFEPIKPVRLNGSVLTIEVPSHFFREYIEEHFVDLLSKALRRELGKEAKLEYSVRVVSGGETVTVPQQTTQEIKNNIK